MAIQMRRGNDADYNPSKMLPAEFGVAVDKGKAYLAFSAGVSKQLMTVEDAQESIQDAVDLSAKESEAWAHGDSFTDMVETTDNFVGDGNTTAFTLSVTPKKMKSVSVNGYNTTAFTLDGNTLTLSTAPLNGVAVVAVSETESPVDTSTDNAKYYKDQAEAAAKVVFDNKTNIDAVAENVEALNTVSENIQTVKDINDNVEAVKTVSEKISDVTTVSENMENIGTVKDNIVDVNTVAGAVADVQTVSASIADVNTAAAHATDLENITANLEDIQNADDNAAQAKTQRDESEKFAQESEAWARGSIDGKDLADGEGEQYQNNSKYYSEQAAASKAQAAEYEAGAQNYYEQVKTYAGTVVPQLLLDPDTGRLYMSPDGKNINFALLEGHLYYQLTASA